MCNEMSLPKFKILRFLLMISLLSPLNQTVLSKISLKHRVIVFNIQFTEDIERIMKFGLIRTIHNSNYEYRHLLLKPFMEISVHLELSCKGVGVVVAPDICSQMQIYMSVCIGVVSYFTYCLKFIRNL